MEITKGKANILNILYYFKEKNIVMDKWQQFHIFDELRMHNIHFTIYNPLSHSTISEANEMLIQFMSSRSFDLFMTPHNENDLFIDTLKMIKKKGIPTLLICFDNLIIPYYHKRIAPHFDLVWLTSKETENMFLKWGARVIFNPYAANPYYFRPKFDIECDRIVFIGTPYGSRVNMINNLVEKEVPISLYANITSNDHISSNTNNTFTYLRAAIDFIRFDIGRKIIWGAAKQKLLTFNRLNENPHYLEIFPAASLEELSGLYSKYALSLSSTAARNTGILKYPVHIVNLRSFEIPMCGGLQVCSYFEELAEYFEEDREIVFYRSNDELVEKTRYYLQDKSSDLRKRMKLSARRRAENEHTWYIRFKKVFNYLGLQV
jgi:glycosyltransferase involved in cell wall biosynthesis